MSIVLSATVVGYNTSSPIVAASGEMRLLFRDDLNPKKTKGSAVIQSVFEDINGSIFPLFCG